MAVGTALGVASIGLSLGKLYMDYQQKESLLQQSRENEARLRSMTKDRISEIEEMAEYQRFQRISRASNMISASSAAFAGGNVAGGATMAATMTTLATMNTVEQGVADIMTINSIARLEQKLEYDIANEATRQANAQRAFESQAFTTGIDTLQSGFNLYDALEGPSTKPPRVDGRSPDVSASTAKTKPGG
jgi:hypothetical protein